MDKREALDEVNRAYRRSPQFGHLREEGSRFVAGFGPVDARVVVIGEAPGRQEDAERMPFVGRSGSVLDRMLGEYGGIGRDQCYVTNVVKYRPPGNRDPEPDEIAASKPYVGQEIVIVGAPIIVLVGRISFGMVFPGHSISSEHGQVREHKGRKYLPTYHPAVALYNRLMIEDLRKDFAALSRLLVEET